MESKKILLNMLEEAAAAGDADAVSFLVTFRSFVTAGAAEEQASCPRYEVN